MIIDTQNDYIIGVKMNQKTLCKQIQMMTSDPQTVTSIFSELEYNKSRTERREVWVSNAPAQMIESWIGLKQVIKVKRMVKDKGKTRVEDVYYISSRAVNAQLFCRA